MRLNKLSHKSINSWLLLAALFAPIVYLFGALWTTQLGAHGEPQLSEPVYVQDYIETDSIVSNGLTYKLVVNSFAYPDSPLFNLPNVRAISFDFTFNNVAYSSFSAGYWDGGPWYVMFPGDGASIYRYQVNDGIDVYPTQLPWAFVSDEFPDTFISLFPDATYYVLTDVPSSTENGSLSDYLFKNFFAKDNFLAKSGKQVIEGTQNYGFQPMGELIRYTDANMLHLANLEYGYLIIGYAYYAMHVIFLDLIVYLTLFIPRLIRGLVDRLEGGVDL